MEDDNPDEFEVLFKEGAIGVTYEPTDGRIIAVSPNGQAARSGVTVGMRITKLNGVLIKLDGWPTSLGGWAITLCSEAVSSGG